MTQTLLISTNYGGLNKKAGLIYPSGKLPDYADNDGYVKYTIPDDVERYIPFFNVKRPDEIGQYITENMTLDTTSDMFISEYRRWMIKHILEERNSKLTKCDWTQMSDNGMSEEKREAWKLYRQQLRDVPSNIQYDENNQPLNVVWPEAPNS